MQVFSCQICKIFKNTFFENSCKRLHLKQKIGCSCYHLMIPVDQMTKLGMMRRRLLHHYGDEEAKESRGKWRYSCVDLKTQKKTLMSLGVYLSLKVLGNWSCTNTFFDSDIEHYLSIARRNIQHKTMIVLSWWILQIYWNFVTKIQLAVFSFFHYSVFD